MTALAAALNKAGVNTDQARLWRTVCDFLAETKGNEHLAAGKLASAIHHDMGLRFEVSRIVTAQINADRNRFSPKGEASGQLARDTHVAAAARKVEGEGDQDMSAGYGQARPISSPSSEHDGKGHPSDDAQHTTARPVVPSPQSAKTIEAVRKARSEAAKLITLTVLDTDRLMNGDIIGRIKWGSLPRLRARSAYEAALLQLIINHGVADPHAEVRDVLKVEVYQRMKQKAAEIANAD